MYLLSDILYLIAYYLVGYRRKLVRDNLAKSFPNLDQSQRRKIERHYYRHLCDLLIEGIYNLFASPVAIKKRYRIENRQLVDQFYERGQTVILMSAHYNNWEYMVSSLNIQLLHHGIGVGKPLESKLLSNFVARKRTRFGTQVVYADNVRQEVEFYDRNQVPCALMMLSDQSPTNPYRSYWTSFLNQDTAFLYGAENFARKYNYPVLYYVVNKQRRGRYTIKFQLISEHPQLDPQYSITERYVRLLEQQITDQPAYWLWSHRRWKLTRNGRIQKDGSIKIMKKP